MISIITGTYVILSNLFYDMQSKFQNEVLMPKSKNEIHFITSLGIFSVAYL
jgi:hypothetical protein